MSCLNRFRNGSGQLAYELDAVESSVLLEVISRDKGNLRDFRL